MHNGYNLTDFKYQRLDGDIKTKRERSFSLKMRLLITSRFNDNVATTIIKLYELHFLNFTFNLRFEQEIAVNCRETSKL